MAGTTMPYLAAAMIAFASTTAGAQDAGSRQTREFVQAAGESDQFEILAGQAALAQSRTPAIRAFAEQMIRVHGDTSRALEQATVRAGLQPPPKSIGGDQARLLSALQGLNGPEFDQAYAHHQALAHRSALVVEQGYAAAGDVATVRQLARATVPMIDAHRIMADALYRKVGGR